MWIDIVKSGLTGSINSYEQLSARTTKSVIEEKAVRVAR